MRDAGYICCTHCETEFLATPKQVENSRAGRRAYCSPACSRANNEARRPVANYGPCPQCGEMFASKYPKTHCSMKCLIKSPAHRQRLIDNNAKKMATRVDVACLECGKEFKRKASSKNKNWCCREHYRIYMAKRFDRWIASPQEMQLPQAYDEFLTQTELPCLIKGCGWSGGSLGMHMNVTHGITAEDFKRAAGFNLGSGLVSPDVSRALSERPHLKFSNIAPARAALSAPRTKNYVSFEAAEHQAKARALLCSDAGPTQTCKQCSRPFTQSTPYGRTLFCQTSCRSLFYNRVKAGSANCGECGALFEMNRPQDRRARKGLPVFCCFQCRQIRNGSASRPRPPASLSGVKTDA